MDQLTNTTVTEQGKVAFEILQTKLPNTVFFIDNEHLMYNAHLELLDNEMET
jgi:hypothetical protein